MKCKCLEQTILKTILFHLQCQILTLTENKGQKQTNLMHITTSYVSTISIRRTPSEKNTVRGELLET